MSASRARRTFVPRRPRAGPGRYGVRPRVPLRQPGRRAAATVSGGDGSAGAHGGHGPTQARSVGPGNNNAKTKTVRQS